jgi:hypothetical protein
MKITIGNHFFPHPVLGNRNDIDSNITFSLNPIKKTETTINLSGTASITNRTILEMLKCNDATCLLHIESPLTGFRKYERIVNWDNGISKFKTEFLLRNLRGNIDINLLCISNTNKKDYSPDGLSIKYENAKFEITKGSILGFAKQKSFSLPDDNSKSSGGALFIIKENTDETMKIDFSNNKGQSIAILVPKSAYPVLDNIVKGGDTYFTGILVNTFFFPCLVEALSIYKEDQNAFPWCKYLEESLAEQGFSIGSNLELGFDDRLEIAQKILNKAFPLGDLIKKYRSA